MKKVSLFLFLLCTFIFMLGCDFSGGVNTSASISTTTSTSSDNSSTSETTTTDDFTTTSGSETSTTTTITTQPEVFSVTFVNTLTGSSTSITVNPGSYLPYRTDSMEGYEFVGWYTSSDEGVTKETVWDFSSDTVHSNLVLYTEWEPFSYVIRFYDGTTLLNTISVGYGTTIPPVDPFKDHYEFRGWYTEPELIFKFNFDNTITSSIDLYARWAGPIVYSYEVTFITNGGPELDSVYIIENYILPQPSISREGYTLEGWYLDEEFTVPYNFNLNVNQALTIYAKWVINQYEITFDTLGGEVQSSLVLDYHADLALPTPLNSGFDFDGWYLDEDFNQPFDLETMPAESIHLYAMWVSPIEELTYQIIDQEVMITGYTGSQTALILPNSIADMPVVRIGANAFSNQYQLVSVKIGKFVSTIDDSAFSNDTSLTSIIFTNKTTSIGAGIFSGCTSMKSMTLSSEASYSLGYYFNDVIPSTIESIFFAEGSDTINRAIYSSEMNGATLYLASSPTVIPFNQFANTEFLYKIVVPEGITEIGDRAFYMDPNLTYLSLPKSVTKIGSAILYGASSLQELEIPYIGQTRTSELQYGVFGYFFGTTSFTGSYKAVQQISRTQPTGTSYYVPSSLIKITITDTTRLPYGSLQNLVMVQEIILPDTLVEINPYALSGTGVITITIPATVELIDQNSFSDSDYLTEVIFSEGINLERIKQSAFANDVSLISVILPSTLVSIEAGGFYNCTSLSYVWIPESLDYINSNAFGQDNRLVLLAEGDDIGLMWSTTITQPILFSISGVMVKEDFVYAISDESGLIVLQYLDNENPEYVTIPKMEETYPVIGVGPYAFYRNDSIISVSFEADNEVYFIGEYAFYFCSNLESIDTPQNLEYIDSHAFAYSGLHSFYVPSSLREIGEVAFSGIPISEFVFPEDTQITVIDYAAFQHCESLESFVIPNTVTFLGESVFVATYAMTSFVIEEGTLLDNIPYGTLAHATSLQSITIPASILNIGEQAFYNCLNLTTIVFENNSLLEVIGDSSFYGCSSLLSFSFPDTIIEIYPFAFKDCTSLTEVILPSKLEFLGDHAFAGCSSVQSVQIPSSLIEIPWAGFSECDILTLSIPETVQIIGNEAFLWNRNLSLITFEGTSQLTEIRASAFQASIIPSIEIPKSVISIGAGAFTGTYTLETLSFEEDSQLLSIGSRAFFNCYNLQSVILPNGLQSIDFEAFACYSPNFGTFGHTYNDVMEVFYIPDSVTTVSYRILQNVRSVTIYVEGSAPQVDWSDNWNIGWGGVTTGVPEVVYNASIPE